MSKSGELVVETDSLTKRYGDFCALDSLSIHVERGQILGFIGPNGAGKTTFLNMVTGYLKPTRGSILFEGRDITALGPRQITRLGICRSFQIPQLFDTLSVRENLMVGVGIVATAAWCAIASFIIFKLIDLAIGLRVDEEQEAEGLDVSFSHATGGAVETPFRERASFAPLGPVKNGSQELYGLDYRTEAIRIGEDEPFHTEVGYWLWDAADGEVMRCFLVPRGSALIAGCVTEPDALPGCWRPYLPRTNTGARGSAPRSSHAAPTRRTSPASATNSAP